MKTHTERIALEDTFMSAMIKVVDGNSGAINVLMAASKESEKIDPDNFFKSLGPIMSCDATGVYGSEIWILYKDVCGSRIPAFLAMFRANQLGFVADVKAIKREEVDGLWDKVCEQLPKFQKRI